MSEKVFAVFFDAKMKTYIDRKQYVSFVKQLKGDGFCMLQKSIYYKFCVDSSSLKSQSERIKRFTPDTIQAIILSIPPQSFNDGVYFNCKKPVFLKNKSIVRI